MKSIYTDIAPTPGAYSQGVLVDPTTHKLLFLAGQTGNDKASEGEAVVDGGVGSQTTQTLKNMLAVVKAAGGDADSFVSMDVFLKDSDDRKGSREAYDVAYRAFFAEHGRTKERGNMPARVQVWVSEVPWEFPLEDTVVEIRGIAAIRYRLFQDA